MIHEKWGPCPKSFASEWCYPWNCLCPSLPGLAGPSESRLSLMWNCIPGNFLSSPLVPGTDWARTSGILLVCSETGPGLMVVSVPASLFFTCQPSSNVEYTESTRCPKGPLTSALHLCGCPGFIGQTQVPEKQSCWLPWYLLGDYVRLGHQSFVRFVRFRMNSLMLDSEWIHSSGLLVVYYWLVCLTCVRVCVSWCVFQLLCCLWSSAAGQQVSFKLWTSSSLDAL